MTSELLALKIQNNFTQVFLIGATDKIVQPVLLHLTKWPPELKLNVFT